MTYLWPLSENPDADTLLAPAGLGGAGLDLCIAEVVLDNLAARDAVHWSGHQALYNKRISKKIWRYGTMFWVWRADGRTDDRTERSRMREGKWGRQVLFKNRGWKSYSLDAKIVVFSVSFCCCCCGVKKFCTTKYAKKCAIHAIMDAIKAFDYIIKQIIMFLIPAVAYQ